MKIIDVLALDKDNLKYTANVAQAKELVALIYALDAEIAEKKKLLDEAKRSLILIFAPAPIAEKVRQGLVLEEAELVALAEACEGSYQDAAGQMAIVVVPKEGSVSLDLYAEDAYKAWLKEKGKSKGSVKLAREWRAEREAAARELAGDHFKVLFDHTVLYEPMKGFADFVPKLLTPAKGRDLTDLVTAKKAPQSPYVKLDRKKEE